MQCDDCFRNAWYVATHPRYPLPEYYCDQCVKANALDCGMTVTAIDAPSRPLTEADVWADIAEANGMDVSEIMDGDLAEWL